MTTELLFCGNNINKANMLELKNQILKAFTNGSDDIHILFDSKGGELFYALEFYKFIAGLAPDQKAKLHIHSDGLIQSAAVLCFLSFDNRYITDKSSLKIQRDILEPMSTIKSQKQKTLDSLNDQMMYIITKIVSFTNIEIGNLKTNEAVDMTYQDAIQKGVGQKFDRVFQAGAIKIADVTA
jgi:ATP-dependent protease ClpP protease subunit